MFLEAGEFLGDSIFQQSECRGLEASHGIAIVVGDDDVEDDSARGDVKRGDAWLGRLLRRKGERGEQKNGEKQTGRHPGHTWLPRVGFCSAHRILSGNAQWHPGEDGRWRGAQDGDGENC